MKKIIVTGGSGFIGSNLVHYLIKKKYFVINIDKLTYSSNNYNKKKLSKNNYKFLKFDINNKTKLKKVIKKYNPECIFNLAAETHVDRSIDSPHQFIHSNILGVFNILEVIKDHNKKNKKIKLIHISTDGVYPSTKGNYKEKSTLKPYNIYGWTKYFAEKIVKKYSNSIIIRTRFFDKNKIKFDTAATDIYTSMIEVKKLVKEIYLVSKSPFKGVINIGSKRQSDYQNYVKYKQKIKPCKRKDIIKDLSFILAKDASLNISKLTKLKKKWKKNYQ